MADVCFEPQIRTGLGVCTEDGFYEIAPLSENAVTITESSFSLEDRTKFDRLTSVSELNFFATILHGFGTALSAVSGSACGGSTATSDVSGKIVFQSILDKNNEIYV